MMRSTPGYPPGGIRVPSSFSRLVQVFETQSRIAPTGHAATSRISASTSKVPKRRVVATRGAPGSVAPLCLDRTLGAHTAQQGTDRPFTYYELAPGTQHLDHLSAITRHLHEHRQHAVLDDSFAKLCGEAIDRHRRYCSARILALQGWNFFEEAFQRETRQQLSSHHRLP